jgi:pimeloyl-ACP methyl ester carboxylesterase
MNTRLPFDRYLQLALAVVTACALGSCATYSKVSERRPRFIPFATGVGPLANAQTEIARATQRDRRDPLIALGEYMSAAEVALHQLDRNPNDQAARNTYNFAVGRIIATIRQAKLDPWTQPMRVPASGGEFVLTHKPDPRPQWNPALYDFTPADQFDVRGTYVTERTTRDGIGAPVVAVGREVNKEARTNFSLDRIYYGVTAIARFEGRRCVLSFEDPLAVETVRIDGRIYPLAADFTVPLAVMLASTNPKKFELSRMLNPAKYAETARISRLQPYDPNKVVVLVIHGLMDTPATWTPMLNRLRGYEEIRRNYQFWFYSYPSGYPYPYSAAILRHELDAIEKRFPLRKPMVVIGHSMGGCISRLLITDAGDQLWMEYFKKPPEQVPLSPESRRLITDALIFQHRPEIGRVIFISAPLRGSELASNWLGRIGSRLIRSPVTLLKAGSDMLKIATFRSGELKLNRIPNSVDTLAPTNRFVLAINTIPITPGIPYHTIMGDRGRGDAPNSSDGVVPYWSSHMEGAKSELIVPSGHPAHQNPKAIEEVHRILVLNVGQNPGKRSNQGSIQIPKLPKATSESAASGVAESPPSEEQICSSEGGGVQPRRGASKAFAAPVSARKANSENRNLVQ